MHHPEVHEGLDSLRRLSPGAVATIGNFDGMHVGHSKLIQQALDLCLQNAKTTSPYRPLVAITFEPHPLTVLRPELAPPRLTSVSEKLRLLKAAGVHEVVILPPTPDVLGLTAEDFWAILRDESKISALVEGDNFAFGKARGGNIQSLTQWSHRDNLRLMVVDSVKVPLSDMLLAPVSSSLVRWLLHHGRVRDAHACLGRPYCLTSMVEAGNQRGRLLGFPTANLANVDQMLPGDGVYAAWVKTSANQIENSGRFISAVSIGRNPTFNGQQRLVEAHLIGFEGNLYGQSLEVEFVDWIRAQEKFSGVEALKAQLHRDLVEVKLRCQMSQAKTWPVAWVA